MLSSIKALRGTRNPFLLFLPFLVLFIIYVLIFPTDGTSGDQPRYLRFASNLLHGFYSPSTPNIDLRNGPGYPIILMPFIALKLPLITITLLNAVLHYLSIVLLFKAIKHIASFKKALVISLFWGFYYIAYQYMSAISYEPISGFLISLMALYFIKAFNPREHGKTRRPVYLTGIILGFLIVTKVIFAYVVFFLLFFSILLWATKRSNINYKKSVLILLIACLTTVPYLIYTYNLTGRSFYWGTGQENLYWMTTPYEDEYGDWKDNLERGTVGMGNFNVADAGDSLKAHHQKDYNEINKYTGLERDDVLKKLAIANIKSHPAKYAKNIFYNISRMIFHYPFSYAVQRPKVLFVFPINGIMLALIAFCLIPTIKNWRKIAYPIKFLLLFTLLYLGVSSLVCAEVRVFALIAPVFLIWFAYIFEKTIKVNPFSYD